MSYEHLGHALGTDFFTVREQFTDEQWDRFITTRRFVDEQVRLREAVEPIVTPFSRRTAMAGRRAERGQRQDSPRPRRDAAR